ncbi:MAG: SLATT domain-containing protein [Fimbriimonadaceae bacterium]|nr:SLATT domain-containing protein [Fimbriimonadaceae bacterium]
MSATVGQGDLQVTTLNGLGPPPGSAADLDRIYQYVVRIGAEAQAWYLQKKSRPATFACSFRLWASLMAALGALLPLIDGLVQSYSSHRIPPMWASVAILLAGALLGMDKAFGTTSRWMRMVTTAMKLRSIGVAFELDWAAARAALGEREPTAAEAVQLIHLARQAASRICGAIESETASWAQDLVASLKELDKPPGGRGWTDPPRPEPPTATVGPTGAVRVEITNHTAEDDGWSLTIGEIKVQSVAGDLVVLANVPEGQLALQACPARDGARRAVEQQVTIVGGETTVVKLEWPALPAAP